jgi:hypothetical protein
MTALVLSPRLSSSVVAEHVSLARVDGRRDTYVQCAAETAECTCPEFCERDHENE